MVDQEALEQQIASVKSHLAFLESLRLTTEPRPIAKKSDRENVLKKLLLSQKWPRAIEPLNLCNPYSDIEKIQRGTNLLEHLTDRQLSFSRFLDFGCGEGHVAYAASSLCTDLAVGYDIKDQGWCRFPAKSNLHFSASKDLVESMSPFDIIFIHDVIDHDRDPIESLQWLRKLCSMHGRVYLRCHPYYSRHGCHGYQKLNRAFCHIFFDFEELKSFGWDGIWANPLKQPIQQYREWISETGWNIISEKLHKKEAENFFTKIPYLNQKSNEFHEAMEINAVDYILSKN